MHFPDRITVLPHEKQAAARLRFILMLVALEFTEHPSMRKVARVIGCDNATLSIYIKRGAFTINMATKIEETFKKPGLGEQLVNPMGIKAA